MAISLFALILIFIIIIFAIQNADLMVVKFLKWQFSTPKAVLLFISLVTGYILAAIWYAVRYVSFGRIVKEFSKKLKENEEIIKVKDEELEKLKSEEKHSSSKQ